jgi:hypothetical protein
VPSNNKNTFICGQYCLRQLILVISIRASPYLPVLQKVFEYMHCARLHTVRDYGKLTNDTLSNPPAEECTSSGGCCRVPLRVSAGCTRCIPRFRWTLHRSDTTGSLRRNCTTHTIAAASVALPTSCPIRVRTFGSDHLNCVLPLLKVFTFCPYYIKSQSTYIQVAHVAGSTRCERD